MAKKLDWGAALGTIGSYLNNIAQTRAAEQERARQEDLAQRRIDAQNAEWDRRQKEEWAQRAREAEAAYVRETLPVALGAGTSPELAPLGEALGEPGYTRLPVREAMDYLYPKQDKFVDVPLPKNIGEYFGVPSVRAPEKEAWRVLPDYALQYRQATEPHGSSDGASREGKIPIYSNLVNDYVWLAPGPAVDAGIANGTLVAPDGYKVPVRQYKPKTLSASDESAARQAIRNPKTGLFTEKEVKTLERAGLMDDFSAAVVDSMRANPEGGYTRPATTLSEQLKRNVENMRAKARGEKPRRAEALKWSDLSGVGKNYVQRFGPAAFDSVRAQNSVLDEVMGEGY